MQKLTSLVLILALMPIGLVVASSEFPRTLVQGMVGEDVRTLQKLLNTNLDTRITASGVGSPGRETSYFGPATKQALIKFQEKYSVEVLLPAGFLSGTGVLGPRTRDKLLSLKNNNTEVFPLKVPSVGDSVVSKIKNNTSSIAVSPVRKVNTSFPLITRSEFSISPEGLGSYADYYIELADLSARTTFSAQDYSAMKKIENKNETPGGVKERIATLEDLMDLVKQGESLDTLKPSFLAWAHLSERMSAELRKIETTERVFPANQEMASWFSYHASVSRSFVDRVVSDMDKDLVIKEYDLFALEHGKIFSANMNKADTENPEAFSFIKKANAFSCLPNGPVYNFGGRVLYVGTCLYGVVDLIGAPCGGTILFSFPMMAANTRQARWSPYLTGRPIMGKSRVTPGVCLISPIPPIGYPYEAIAILFGGSLI